MAYDDQLPQKWVHEAIEGFHLTVSHSSRQRARVLLTALLKELRGLGHEPKTIEDGYWKGRHIDVHGVICPSHRLRRRLGLATLLRLRRVLP